MQSARDHGLSWPVAWAAFTAHAQRVLPDQPGPVTVLGIDEIRRGRPRWAWDETTGSWQTTVDRWHVGFVDLSGGQGLLGQVEGRTSTAVTAWLGERTQAWRDGAAFVAIDMCTIFKSAVRAALPQARLVVDHLYIVQLANAAVTEVRRRVTVQVRGRRGRKGNREWELRNRLTRSAARMHASQLDPMVDDLMALPKRIGDPILAAWNAKEDLLDLLALARPHPDRTVVADRLFRFYDRCADSGLPELERLASTVQTWWPEILAFLHTGITNAGSEGTNRVIKTVARDAYGFRNPENQRLRTRCATTRRSRGPQPRLTSKSPFRSGNGTARRKTTGTATALVEGPRGSVVETASCQGSAAGRRRDDDPQAKLLPALGERRFESRPRGGRTCESATLCPIPPQSRLCVPPCLCPRKIRAS
ncbi:ISL3 family transposase [Microbispora sp. H11081]|uniref:ISL3 family transposase n=1 Tax=Microbispora sp. H11081 TaxID=2729107 RepID=UPI001B8BCD04